MFTSKSQVCGRYRVLVGFLQDYQLSSITDYIKQQETHVELITVTSQILTPDLKGQNSVIMLLISHRFPLGLEEVLVTLRREVCFLTRRMAEWVRRGIRQRVKRGGSAGAACHWTLTHRRLDGEKFTNYHYANKTGGHLFLTKWNDDFFIYICQLKTTLYVIALHYIYFKEYKYMLNMWLCINVHRWINMCLCVHKTLQWSLL